MAQAVLSPREYADGYFGKNQLYKALSNWEEKALGQGMWYGFDYSMEGAEATIVQPSV